MTKNYELNHIPTNMKTNLLSFIIIFVYSLQIQAQIFSGTASISVTLKNSNETNAKLSNSEGSVDKQFSIKNQQFNDTMTVSRGYYELNFSDQYTLLYLEPGFELQASLDYKNFDESLQYEGKGSVENNYLAASMIRSITHRNEKNKEIREDKFISGTNSYFENEKQLLKQLNGASDYFVRLEEKRQYLNKIQAFHTYTIMQMVAKGQTYTVSDSFPNLLDELNLNDTNLLVIQEYAQLVHARIQQQTTIVHKTNSSVEFGILYLDMLNSMVTEPSIKNRVIAENGAMRLAYSTNKKVIYEKMLSMISDKKVEKEITDEYRRWEKLEAGNPSPDFSFWDLNDQVVTLKDLQGKFVYIDVWATWCGPCLMEIPHLKKLTETLKDRQIQFVSICMKDKKETWKSMVRAKELKGIQLFAENPEDDFFKSYRIDGIPRFILLNRNGIIVDANAKRPSDPELIKILETLQ